MVYLDFFAIFALINRHTPYYNIMRDYISYIAIIPARWASTRFPGKPLAMLGGKTIIERVYERVASVLPNAYVATDDLRILQEVERFGGQAVMTSTNHKSGTDRVEEAMEKIGGKWDVVVNVQGDEPFIHPSQITSVCDCFDDDSTQIATLGKPFGSGEEFMEAIRNPNSPKIVMTKDGYALYFSRSVIPFVRGKEPKDWPSAFPFLKHLGLYAYRRDVLAEITRLPVGTLEQAESLEQLRWLENGYRIKVGITNEETIGIDTPDDLRKAESLLSSP